MNVRKSKITSSSKAGRLAVVPMVMYTRQFAKMGALLLLVYCSSYGSDVATLFLSNYNEINNNMRYLNAAFLMCISLMDHNIYDPEVSPELRYYPQSEMVCIRSSWLLSISVPQIRYKSAL